MNSKRDELWHRDDQFQNQFSTKFQTKQIENRWYIFKNLIVQKNFDLNEKIKALDFGCGDGINILGIKNILNMSCIKKGAVPSSVTFTMREVVFLISSTGITPNTVIRELRI